MDILSGLWFVATLFFWFLVIVIPLVIVHEFGHTIMAWLFKIRVIEFGVGLPPRTRFSFRARKMLWSLNWLPLGGFARIYGDHDALDTATSELATNPKDAKLSYEQNRMQEVVDADLPQLLENNGLEYNEEWQRFHALVQKNSWAVNYFLEHGGLEPGWEMGSGKNKPRGMIATADLELIKNNLTQLPKLISWEFDGMQKTKTAFFNRGFIPKFVVLIGGVLFNYLFAWLIIFGLLNFGSVDRLYASPETLPSLPSTVIVTNDTLTSTIQVIKDSALSKAGVPNRVKVLQFNGQAYSDYKTFNDFRDAVQKTNGSTVALEYTDLGSDKLITKQVTPLKNDKGVYLIGASPIYMQSYKAKDFGSSFAATTSTVNDTVKTIWNGLGNIFKALLPSTKDKSALESVGGPIAISGFGTLTYQLLGVKGILNTIAQVSLSLAVFNLLPLPVLDGGRILIAFLNKITGKRNRRLEATLINGTMIILLVLFVFIAYRDVGTIKSVFG